MFTDIGASTITSTPGLSVRIVVDDRFDSSPSVIKWLVMIIGVLAAIVALAALASMVIAVIALRRRGRLGTPYGRGVVAVLVVLLVTN
ncbi:hypothetical protein KC220_22670, partial [Mycobacterium tuberculosis]|nr:hypothetical protein [Mycobacterium tuberculosis]